MDFPGLASVPNVYQGGHVTFSGDTYKPVPIMAYSGFAVDCHTWGISTLIPYMGNAWVEKKLGADGAYNMWQQVKARAGYFDADKKIAGVGFTQVINPNCTAADNNTCTTHEIWTAEWSFGAALMAKTIANYVYNGTDEVADGKFGELMGEAQNIRKNLLYNRAGHGLNNNDTVGEYADVADGGMLYANKRFFIPWGWYANAVSSLCSTSWSIMDDHDYNPFVLGGGKPMTPKKNVAEMIDENFYGSGLY